MWNRSGSSICLSDDITGQRMRPPHQLVHSRARVAQRFALFPLEGYPVSRLPSWPDAEVRVLASPALGAGFVQMLIDLPAGEAGGGMGGAGGGTVFYVLSGGGGGGGGEGGRGGGVGVGPPGGGGEVGGGGGGGGWGGGVWVGGRGGGG